MNPTCIFCLGECITSHSIAFEMKLETKDFTGEIKTEADSVCESCCEKYVKFFNQMEIK